MSIDSIATDTFANHASLQYLYLENNNLVSIETEDFN
jgi:hypothetical protein